MSKLRGRSMPPKRPNAGRGSPLLKQLGMCWCRQCDVKEAQRLKSKLNSTAGPISWLPPGITVLRKNLCAHCGFERCPCATDCSLGCTNSNLPDQPGSMYESARSRGTR